MGPLKKIQGTYAVILLSMTAVFCSCHLDTSSSDYKIFAMVTCDGSATSPDYNSMTVNYYVDKQYPFTDVKKDTAGVSQVSITLPKKITTITITATKVNSDSTLNVILYKNTNIVKYANLPSCASTYSSCTNTISIDYNVEDDKTKAATGSSTSSSSSTTSSSTSSSSSSG